MNAFENIIWSPSEYVNAAVIANLAGEEMLKRLTYMTLQPKRILDVGCGPGVLLPKLQKQYLGCFTIALDYSEHMIRYTQQQNNDVACICGDFTRLPLPDHSVDLIFANLTLPWCDHFKPVLGEWLRVLRPEGVLMLSALGIDTFKEFGEEVVQLPKRLDMHDLGDLLMQVGFADPVLDVDQYSLVYSDKKHLVQELLASGVVGFPMDFGINEDLELTYEVIYAHAFAPAPSNIKKHKTGESMISLAEVRQQLNKS